MNFFESIVLHHRQAPTVKEQPRSEMTNWRVVFTPCCQDRLLTGWLRGSESLRVTTAIKNVDAASWTVTTESGRVYEILTPPTADPGYLSLILMHSRAMGLVDTGNDESDRLWANLQGARH